MADLLELTPHVFLLEIINATRTNIYVVREPDGDTLVDPGPVGTAQIMPYYGMPVGLRVEGKPIEEVAFGFNKDVVTGLLLGWGGYRLVYRRWRETPHHSL